MANISNHPNFGTPMFHQGHYNVIAAEIRDQLNPHYYHLEKVSFTRAESLDQIQALTLLAVSIAKRFKLDNQHFDPRKFLDQCSPDPKKLPFHELWKDGDELE